MLRKFGKGLLNLLTIMAVLFLSSSAVFATEVIPTAESYQAKALYAIGAMIATGFCMGVGAVGAALAIGSAATAACEAVGRNPGAQGKILMTMLVGMAMAESIAIYCLVIALVLLYANPIMKYFFVG